MILYICLRSQLLLAVKFRVFHFRVCTFNVFAHVQSKCKRYWCDEMNKPFEIADRGFTVTATTEKMYADYEIRDMTIRYVSVQEAAIH